MAERLPANWKEQISIIPEDTKESERWASSLRYHVSNLLSRNNIVILGSKHWADSNSVINDKVKKERFEMELIPDMFGVRFTLRKKDIKKAALAIFDGFSTRRTRNESGYSVPHIIDGTGLVIPSKVKKKNPYGVEPHKIVLIRVPFEEWGAKHIAEIQLARRSLKRRLIKTSIILNS